MTSSQFSNSESQRPQHPLTKNSNQVPTKKSLYAEPQKSDLENSGIPDSYTGAQKQEECEIETTPNPKQLPQCCNACNIF